MVKNQTTKTENNVLPVSPEYIERKIFIVQGLKVMLDTDLADLYQVSTGSINRAVRRNIGRFPPDFMFQLSEKEFENLRCQFGISSSSYGGRRYMPYVFTELGVSMLSSVLKSDRAIDMNILIMRAFVKLREMILTHKDIADKVEKLERNQKEYSEVLMALQSMIKHLFDYPAKASTPIGFRKNGT